MLASWRADLLWRRPLAHAHQVVRADPLAERGLHGRRIQLGVMARGDARLVERQADFFGAAA